MYETLQCYENCLGKMRMRYTRGSVHTTAINRKKYASGVSRFQKKNNRWLLRGQILCQTIGGIVANRSEGRPFLEVDWMKHGYLERPSLLKLGDNTIR